MFSSSFGPSAGFVAPVGLAVDNSSGGSRGDVYVADQGSDVLYRFPAGGGSPLGQVAVAGASLDGVAVDSYPNVNESDVLVAGLSSGVVYRFTPGLVLKEELKGLAEPVGAAFDAAGDMFVAEIGGSGGGGKVLEFNAAGVPVDAQGMPSANNTVLEGFGEPRGLAVSADGKEIYIAAPGGALEYSLSEEGSYQQTGSFGGESTTGVAVSSTGDVYANTGSQVTVYEPGGGTLAVLGEEKLASPAYGVGVDEASGKVYVADTGALTVDAFTRGETPEAPGAPSVTGEPGMSARFEGVLRSGGSGTSSYYFQYATGENCAGQQTTPEETATGGAVHAEVSGLSPSAQYTVCLVAKNAFGTSTSAPVTFNTAGVAPFIEGTESFSGVGARSATLSTEVNTENQTVSYHYLYGPAATFATEPEPKGTPEASLAPGSGNAPAAAQLTELEPQTEYDFQIILENTSHQTTKGTIESFRTLPEEDPTLPDKRVNEMVTPVENHDADVYVPFAPENISLRQGIETFYPFQASLGGTAVTYVGDATAGGEGTIGKGLGDQYLARRGPDGWVQGVVQPATRRGTHFQGFTSNLGIGTLNSGGSGEAQEPPLASSAPGGGYPVLYSRNDEAGEGSAEEDLYQPLFTNSVRFNRKANEFRAGLVVSEDNKNGGTPVFAGGAGDLGSPWFVGGGGYSLFEANDDLTAVGSPLRAGLDVQVKAEITSGEENDYLYRSVGGVSEVVDVLPDGEVAGNATFGGLPFVTGNPKVNPPDFSGVAGGGWVYWTDEVSGVVYVRVGGLSVAVSVGAAQYWTSADGGRYAFYVEAGQLWRFDAVSGRREALTAATAGVEGVVGTSEDGQSVYAVASGVLEGAVASGEGTVPVAGEPNLYLLVGSRAPVFIATLSKADGEDVEPMSRTIFGRPEGGEFGDWQPGLGHRTAGVSGDGGAVVFMSDQRLPVVGFPHGYPGEGTDEVYLFQAGSGELFCVSCSSSGERLAAGGAAAFLPVGWSDVHLPEWLGDDGNRVFFDSEVPLVAQDTNGRQDVYEWEREGTGSCAVGGGVNGGCVYLLSGGTSRADSWLVGASESGDDVFVVTRAQLSPLDRNDAFDLYDVRVEGSQPVTAPLCTGTGCQGVPAAAPLFATPASVTFSGVGNFPPLASKPKTKLKKKVLTRAEKLAGALKSCQRRYRSHTRGRVSCEAAAHRKYPKKTVKKKGSAKKGFVGKGSVLLRGSFVAGRGGR